MYLLAWQSEHSGIDLDSSLWKRPRVNCDTNVGKNSLGLNITALIFLMFNLIITYLESYTFKIFYRVEEIFIQK